MRAYKSSAIEFLQRDYNFIIPVYQRNYDWRKEQCQQLFDDLLDLPQRTGSCRHFFGCVVCSCPSMKECIIIDGQQRLTSVSLLILAMARMIEMGQLQSEDPGLAEEMRDKYLAVYRKKHQPKFQHNRDAPLLSAACSMARASLTTPGSLSTTVISANACQSSTTRPISCLAPSAAWRSACSSWSRAMTRS